MHGFPSPATVFRLERFDPVARNLLKFFPSPNAAPTNPFTNQNNFFASGKSPSEEDKFDSRVDHNFSDKFRMYGRGSYSTGSSVGFNAFGNLANSLAGNGSNDTQQYNVSVNGVYTFSPTTLLNVNYGFARQVIISAPFSQGIDLTSLGSRRQCRMRHRSRISNFRTFSSRETPTFPSWDKRHSQR